MIVAQALRKIRKEYSIGKRRKKLEKDGFSFAVPNYLFLNKFDVDAFVVDVGCGYEAEFCIHMIKRYAAMTYGIDPTRKHRDALEKLEKQMAGKFVHISKAVTADGGVLTFNESISNESGSLRSDHRNVANDEIRSYEVECLSLAGLLEEIGRESVDIIKLDLEGAEYDLLSKVNREDLLPFNQIFVEFHHHCIDEFSEADSKERVDRLHSFGLEYASVDDHNYLFYWDKS